VFGDKLIAYIGADGTLKTIDAYDNTKVITAQGTVATADKLNYIASTSLANLDGNVKITDKENIMRGARAKVDFKNEISKMISGPTGKRVTGILTP
jgi:lipopolysaccharide export system protein LptA